uniref:ER membrane protein complex subunit 1 n=1 Tax=Amorphochlora amoebiformis TaxID=1561963 RepID=A0A7S0D4C0_9EUKA
MAVHESSVFGLSRDGRLIEFEEDSEIFRDHKHPKDTPLLPVEGVAFLPITRQDGSIFLITQKGTLVEWRTKIHKDFNPLFGLPRWINHGAPQGMEGGERVISPISGMIAGHALRIFGISNKGKVYEWRKTMFDIDRRSRELKPVFEEQWAHHGMPNGVPLLANGFPVVTKYGVFLERQDHLLSRLYLTSNKLVKVKVTSAEEDAQIATIPKSESWAWQMHPLPTELGGDPQTAVNITLVPSPTSLCRRPKVTKVPDHKAYYEDGVQKLKPKPNLRIVEGLVGLASY